MKGKVSSHVFVTRNGSCFLAEKSTEDSQLLSITIQNISNFFAIHLWCTVGAVRCVAQNKANISVFVCGLVTRQGLEVLDW